MKYGGSYGSFTYAAKGNEGIADIAKRFGHQIDEVMRMNPGKHGILPRGTLVRLPAKKESCARGSFYHIQQGETLASIAKRFGLSLRQLLLANPYLDPAQYVTGQTILIPEQEEEDEEQTMCYCLTRNDSLADVLRRFDMSIVELRRCNPGKDVFRLRAGDEIRVLKWECRGSLEKCMILAQGDSLTSVANSLKITPIELLRVNPNLRPQEFCAGQRIRIP